MSCEFRDYSIKAQEFFLRLELLALRNELVAHSSLPLTISITIESEYPFPTA